LPRTSRTNSAFASGHQVFGLILHGIFAEIPRVSALNWQRMAVTHNQGTSSGQSKPDAPWPSRSVATYRALPVPIRPGVASWWL
jgi:hypothetical protein